ncbi:hypothetical protein LCI18_004663 [Fusarium solani-melongenae]|uniref:Uncharacterized protein n=1 Tax=Fusarium solani subsp. cucurbitae TaxID=2747967 RepID=A0ACD3YXK6_FUSSC|nr:hypothetical protein LCI18_004663 [Fusarium solani-melongenae]
MVTKIYPPSPPFHSLRLATAADIPRMAELSVLGFKDSEIFRFERPGYESFPHDSIASFANMYRSQLQDPRVVAIVAEEAPRPDDATYFQPPHHDATLVGRVVVGVASWVLPEGSSRTGQFVVPGVGDPEPAPDRDLCQRRLDLFTRTKEATENKYLSGKVICDKLVVHPSYQQRGHGTAMLRWGLSLCNRDGVDQGVIPSHVGEPVYLWMGYQVVGEMEVPDDGDVEGFRQRVVVYKAAQRN